MTTYYKYIIIVAVSKQNYVLKLSERLEQTRVDNVRDTYIYIYTYITLIIN